MVSFITQNFKMRFFIFKYVPLVVLCFLVCSACSSPESYDRPIDTWVFRSVMDKQPRMLTVALDKDLYVCYNLQNGNLYKIWKGGVNYDGAVYTTAHQIQPTSFGYVYAQDSTSQTQWKLKTESGVEVPKINFLGYSMVNDQVGIDFELISSSGKSVTVRETPEFDQQDAKAGLIRNINIISGEKGYVPIVMYALNEGVVAEELINGTENKADSRAIEITSNSTIKTYFHPVPEGWQPPLLDLSGSIANGEKLVTTNDCAACHLKNENLVGPAYDSIAKRYSFDWPTIRLLSNKISKGGTGVWGETPMTAHPDLSIKETEDMAYYLLSLDGEPEPQNKEEDFFTVSEAVAAELDAVNRTSGDAKKEKGVAANLYLVNDSGDLYDVLEKSTSPVFNGVLPAIHFPDASELSEVKSDFYVELNGFIKSEKEGAKTFRLISDDGSILRLNGKQLLDNTGNHAPKAVDGPGTLKKGWNSFKIQYHQGGGGSALSFQWSEDGEPFTLVPDSVLYHNATFFKNLLPYTPKQATSIGAPGDQMPLNAVHPSFDMFQAKPADFNPRIGGIDFIDEDTMVICTWDATGSVYLLTNYNTDDPSKIEVKQIAKGLAEPLGIKMVDGELYVLQKQELTKLIDTDNDGIIDEYQKVCDSWHVTSHYHEFAFGLVYKEGSFYATLATDLGSEYKNVPDRGKVVRISKDGSEIEVIAEGFRTPNGISEGPDGALYVSDNQGNWIPTSKIVRVEKGKWYGYRHADWDRVKDYEEQPPLVWLPHTEISNSPSQQAILNLGPYKDQLIYGDVTHGGIKRVFIDEVDGVKQGAAFRFIQGLDAGINRMVWGPDGNLYAGGIGSGGNWRHEGKLWYALHRFNYNANSTFEMLAVRAKVGGMEIELTEPIASIEAITAASFNVQQYYYEATENYGGPKKGEETLEVASVSVSDNRKKVFLEIPGIKNGKVVYIHIRKPFSSENGQALWSTETWYTMTKKPVD